MAGATDPDLRMKVRYDSVYTEGIDPTARFPRERYRRTAGALAARDGGWTVRLLPPSACDPEVLRTVHDPAYVDAFLAGTLDVRAQRRIGLRPWTPALVPRTLLLTGASLQALDDAVGSGGFAGNLAGGTHHAFREMGGGYCVFNDLALCARRALGEHGLRRVLIVDLDVHQGDGTAALFAEEPAVFTFSMHCEANYPFHKQRSDLDVPLPEGTGDEAYLEALDDALPRAFGHDPDLVLFQAGVDGLAADKLGRLSLSRAGMAARTERVLDAVDAAGVPCVVLMGGGYAEPIDPTVDALADTYLAAARRHARRQGLARTAG